MLLLKVPSVGESINEVRLSKLLKKNGEYAVMDEVICELESEKATFELNAEKSGSIHWLAKEGDDLKIGDAICNIDTSAVAPLPNEIPKGEPKSEARKSENIEKQNTDTKPTTPIDLIASPAAKKILADANILTSHVSGSGKGGRITKEDALLAAQGKNILNAKIPYLSRAQRVEQMTPIRKTISKRLVASKNQAAMLTTFNEVDMTTIMELRHKYKDKFKETHGVSLGFMSFFIKACTHALQSFPTVNAQVEEDTIRFFDYCDISIAVSTPKGLVVPVIRNAESKNLAQLEHDVMQLALKGRDNKLTMEEMTGGTFTISNGGVFGSLMSTPIINTPQSAILGMHKIQDRPMAVNGQIVIRAMMYLALSYDHRIIDGKESVGFLVKVKELLENPNGLLFGDDPLKLLIGI